MIKTTLGDDMIAWTSHEGICLLEFADRLHLDKKKERIRSLLNGELTDEPHPHFHALKRQLQEYYKGTRKTFSLPLNLNGTEFQMRVWNELLKIPFGQTRSYKQMAAALGDLNAVRAVGSANSQNPVMIVVPCHRVIGTDGSLMGYSGGVERNWWLLKHEYEFS